MPRKVRIDAPGTVHHIIARGKQRNIVKARMLLSCAGTEFVDDRGDRENGKSVSTVNVAVEKGVQADHQEGLVLMNLI